MSLLDPDFIRRLETLRVLTDRRFAGSCAAQRVGLRRGTSLEFADYREYTPGDSLRHVDWNIYGRLERPYVRTFVEEEDLYVYVLVDTSASMLEGSPQKFLVAKRLAAALSYISLISLDRVAVSAFDGTLTRMLRPQRGRSTVFSILDFLEELPAGGKATDLWASLREQTRLARVPGVAIVISDFLCPDFEAGLKELVHRRFKVHVLQVLSPQEFEPNFDGEVVLTDAETGVDRPVSASPAVLDRYRQVVEAFVTQVAQTCRRKGATHTLARTDRTIEDMILRDLRKSGVVG